MSSLLAPAFARHTSNKLCRVDHRNHQIDQAKVVRPIDRDQCLVARQEVVLNIRSMIYRLIAAGLCLLLTASVSIAQITVRDTIVALPPISICNDGATHRTVCTNLRLRPSAAGSLTAFEGLPLEITGTPGAVTCQFVNVQSVSIVNNTHFSATSATATTMTVDFFGAGVAGDVFLLLIGPSLLPSPPVIPAIGPVHLDLGSAVFVGAFLPSISTPFHSLVLPYNAALIGIDFYDQSLALHSNGVTETTVVDCFQF